LKRTLRVALLLFFTCAALAAFTNFAPAQQIDAAVGLASVLAPAGSSASGNHQSQSLGGAAYASGSVDYLFFRKVIGVQADAAVREDTGTYAQNYLNFPFRPMFFDLNAIWTTKFTKRVGAELVGGAGVINTQFQVADCTSSRCFASTHHFLGDFGVGIKAYAWHHFFIRPEARYYLVNNNVEFSAAHALRYGASIGYTFRSKK